MNIYDMLRRKDKNLTATVGVELTKQRHGNDVWRGLLLPPGSSIRLRDILRFHPFRERPQHCSWTVRTIKDVSHPVAIEVALSAPSGEVVSKTRTAVTGEPSLLFLPWPFSITPLPAVDLFIEVSSAARTDVFLAVHRTMTRDLLLAHAAGVGVEIGPGANPQIRPSAEVDVSYIEQMSVADWQNLYGAGGKYVIEPSLWNNYKIGEANNLPFPDGSLDFIFSSHVFEHLSNPLGHLEHWFKKLRAGGRVLCIVPDLAGTKDALQRPSTLEEILEEYDEGIWSPRLCHYQRYAKYNMPGADAADLLASRRSIHVHFYTNRNMSALLEEACCLFGYAGFHLQHVDNHKDFHFMLMKQA